MFRRNSGQAGGKTGFDASSAPQEPVAGPQEAIAPQVSEQQHSVAEAVSLARQQSRRRTSEPTQPAGASQQHSALEQQQSLANAIALARQQSRRRSSNSAGQTGPNKAGQLAPLRTRVQQPSPITQVQQLSSTAHSLSVKQPANAAASPKQFSIFSNPLSVPRQIQQPQPAVRDARQPAMLQQPAQAEHQQELHDVAATQQDNMAVTAASSKQETSVQDDAAKPSVAESSSPLKQSNSLAAKVLLFEAHPATDYQQLDSALGDSNHDQQQLLGAANEEPSSAPTQQYVYDQDTGQLCRVGEGADATRLAHHYLEDWNTGDFYMMAGPDRGCMSWLKRKPRIMPPGWSLGTLQEPSLLRSLSEFTENMGSVMSALGMFAQGLAGGLALISLFMSYLQYATAGRDGFLAYYSVHAQMVNRAFFTLISLSLVSASSRLAYDQLGNFKPEFLRLKLADGLVLGLYFLAYVCNLIATPIDDQLTYEARRDLTYYTLPLQAAFVNKVSLWQVLNLLRIICCGLAWAITCYRGNHMVMMMVFEARQQQQEEEFVERTADGGVTGGTAGVAVRPAVGDAWRQSATGSCGAVDAAHAEHFTGEIASNSPLRSGKLLEKSSSVALSGVHVQRQVLNAHGIGSRRVIGTAANVAVGVAVHSNVAQGAI